MRGGYYPSAMGSILRTGPLFISSAIMTALKLLYRSNERLESRKRSLRRKHGTRKVKRTRT
jgi:hypothetical protein